MKTTPRRRDALHALWKPLLLLALVITFILTANVLGLGEWLRGLQTYIESLGAWGPAVFVAAYAIATIACLPGWVFSIMGGAIFGPVWGVAWTSLGSTIGAGACFLIARYFARDSIKHWVADNPQIAKLDRMTETHGALFVAITRLLPLFPFNLINYGFGLTRVTFWTYLILSWLCMLPGTVIYVAGSAAVFEGIREGRVPWLLVGFVLVMIAILTIIAREIKQSISNRDLEPAANESIENNAKP